MKWHRQEQQGSAWRAVTAGLVLSVVALTLGVVVAPPAAAADSLGESRVFGNFYVDGTNQIYSGDSMTYGQLLQVRIVAWDVSSSCSPVALDCDAPLGTVELVDGAEVVGSASLQPTSDDTSEATIEIGGGPVSDLHAGAHHYTIRYAGNFDPWSAGPWDIFVNKASCSVALSQSAAQTNQGQPVDFVADLGSVGHSGLVDFRDPIGHSLGQSSLLFGAVGKLTISTLPVGTTDVRARYLGDPDHLPCESGFIRHVVVATATTTSVTASPNPATVGSSVGFAATVAGGTSTPTGTVTFKEGGTTLASATLANGVASFSTAGLAVGSHVVVASYGGDGAHSASSGSVTVDVRAAATTTAVATTPNPSTYGHAVTATATVQGGSTPPTGTVTFIAGEIVVGTGTLDADGLATASTASLPVGTHELLAAYGGDDTHAPSSGSTIHRVDKVATTTALSSSGTPSQVGATVTYTASVSPAAAGSVDFRDGSASIPGCAARPLAGGVASCAVSYAAAGTHQITAVYGGSPTHAASTSSPLTQAVQRVPSTLELTVPAAPPVVAQPWTLTAAVSPASATGVVDFRDAGSPITGCSNRPVVAGEATCTVAWPATGDHSVVASYSGDATYLPSATPPKLFTVAKAPTQLSASPATYSGFLRSSVTVRAQSRHALTGAPVGGQVVEFYSASQFICRSTTGADGVAQCSSGGFGAMGIAGRGGYRAQSLPTASYLGASTTGPAS